MKIRNNFILITALCLAAFVLVTCAFLDGSDQGSIKINFGSSGAREILPGDIATMIYTITLTSPGKNTIKKTTEKGAASITIDVPEGEWDIQVKAEGSEENKRVSSGERTDKVVVTAGETVSKNIKMIITGTRVSNWQELMDDFYDPNMANELSIEIMKNFDADKIYPSAVSGAIELRTGKTITLWAKKDVTINRHDFGSQKNDKTLFSIFNGTLILDGTKGGTITLDGNSVRDCERALINVEGGILEIHDRVTLKDNYTSLGGGVYVNGGSFKMYGGTISDNTANQGGGVYVKGGGSFEMYGGTISGNTAEYGGGVYVDNKDKKGTFIKTGGIISNNKADSGKGNTIYENNTGYELNLDDITDNWPRP